MAAAAAKKKLDEWSERNERNEGNSGSLAAAMAELLLFFFPFLWWVMAAARGRGSAKGKRTKEKTKGMEQQFENGMKTTPR